MKKYILFLLLIITSCKNKFNKKEWQQFEGFLNENRIEMAEDLQQNYFKKKLHFNQIKDLIGNPDKVIGNKNIYVLFEDFGWDIDPVIIHYFDILIDEDSMYSSSIIRRVDVRH